MVRTTPTGCKNNVVTFVFACLCVRACACVRGYQAIYVAGTEHACMHGIWYRHATYAIDPKQSDMHALRCRAT